MKSDEKNYYFIISIPKKGHIEHVTRLNSFILKQFPQKKNPYTIRPLEIRDKDTLSKVTIKTTRENIIKFSNTLFGNDYVFIEHSTDEIEIVRRVSVQSDIEDGELTMH